MGRPGMCFCHHSVNSLFQLIYGLIWTLVRLQGYSVCINRVLKTYIIYILIQIFSPTDTRTLYNIHSYYCYVTSTHTITLCNIHSYYCYLTSTHTITLCNIMEETSVVTKSQSLFFKSSRRSFDFIASEIQSQVNCFQVASHFNFLATPSQIQQQLINFIL